MKKVTSVLIFLSIVISLAHAQGSTSDIGRMRLRKVKQLSRVWAKDIEQDMVWQTNWIIFKENKKLKGFDGSWLEMVYLNDDAKKLSIIYGVYWIKYDGHWYVCRGIDGEVKIENDKIIEGKRDSALVTNYFTIEGDKLTLIYTMLGQMYKEDKYWVDDLKPSLRKYVNKYMK
jgi:hypothetical protein